MEHKWFVGTSPRYSEEVKNKARELKIKDRTLPNRDIAVMLQEIYGFDSPPAHSSVCGWVKYEKNANSKDHKGPMEDFRLRIGDFKGKKGTKFHTEFTPKIQYTAYLDYLAEHHNLKFDKKEDWLEFNCMYCGKLHSYHGDDYFEEDRKLWQMDHIKPRHLKTPNNGMPENMAVCCKECNQMKGEWDMEELLPIMQKIVEYLGKNNG